jgi:hypothetical protein
MQGMIKDWGWGAIKERKNLQVTSPERQIDKPTKMKIKKGIKKQTFQDLFEK